MQFRRFLVGFSKDLCYLFQMTSQTCTTCFKPKAQLACGICERVLCKNCTQFVDEDQFSFLAKLPKELSHNCYCDQCYMEIVTPAIADYEATMARAKEVMVYDKTQGKETRLFKRLELPLHVENVSGEKEVMMRLAFFAAKAGFNSIVDLETSWTKIKNGSYQTTVWAGSAVPTNVDPRKIIKDKSFWSQPN